MSENRWSSASLSAFLMLLVASSAAGLSVGSPSSAVGAFITVFSFGCFVGELIDKLGREKGSPR